MDIIILAFKTLLALAGNIVQVAIGIAILIIVYKFVWHLICIIWEFTHKKSYLWFMNFFKNNIRNKRKADK